MKKTFSFLLCILFALMMKGQHPKAIKNLSDSLFKRYDTYKQVTTEALVGVRMGKIIAESTGNTLKIGEYDMEKEIKKPYVCNGYYSTSKDSDSNTITTVVINPYTNLSFVFSFKAIVRQNKITDSTEVSVIMISDGEASHIHCGVGIRERFIDGSNNYLEKVTLSRQSVLVIRDIFHVEYFKAFQNKEIFYIINQQ